MATYGLKLYIFAGVFWEVCVLWEQEGIGSAPALWRWWVMAKVTMDLELDLLFDNPSGCFYGGMAFLLSDGLSPLWFWILNGKLIKKGGERISTTGANTTHVIACSWQVVMDTFCYMQAKWIQMQEKQHLIFFEWMCDCLRVGKHVVDEKYNPFLLSRKPPSPWR